MADQLKDIVGSSKAEKVASGYEFAVGPVWHPDGHLLFADPQQGQVYRLGSGGKAETMRTDSGGARGMAVDSEGRLVVCETGARRVTRMTGTDTYTPIAERWRDSRLNRPTDVAAHSNGSVYFTDPGNKDVDAADRDMDHNGVYRVDSSGEVSSAVPQIEYPEYPNGIAFSPDESRLYVTNTRDFSQINYYEVQSDGTLSTSHILGFVHSAEPGGVPDGLSVDADGRVYYAGRGGVWVFDASGDHLGTIEVPEPPTGCAWGDSDLKTMYVTATTSVYSLKMKTAGAR